MIDGGALAGYLAVAATRAAGRVFDKAVDGLFDRLAQHVAQRLGWPAVEAINANPGDTAQQRRIGQGIDAVARVDSQFAAELAALQDHLDRRVGRQLINVVNAQYSVQAFGGNAYGGDHYELAMPDPADYSKAPLWVRALIVVGFAVALVGSGSPSSGSSASSRRSRTPRHRTRRTSARSCQASGCSSPGWWCSWSQTSAEYCPAGGSARALRDGRGSSRVGCWTA